MALNINALKMIENMNKGIYICIRRKLFRRFLLINHENCFSTIFLLSLTSCSSMTADKRLNEKTFKAGNITVKWYQISEISSIHVFVDIERWGWTKTIMKANTDGIYDILINGDTIT